MGNAVMVVKADRSPGEANVFAQPDKDAVRLNVLYPWVAGGTAPSMALDLSPDQAHALAQSLMAAAVEARKRD